MSYWSEVGPESTMTSVLMRREEKRREEDSEIETQGRHHMTIETETHCAAAKSQRMPRVVTNHQKLGETQRKILPCGFQREHHPAITRTVQQYISVVVSHPDSGTLLQ